MRPPPRGPPHPPPRPPALRCRRLPASAGADEASAAPGPDVAGRVRLAPPRGVVGAHALRLRHVRDRVHHDALGGRARHALLLRGDPLEFVRAG